MKVILLTLDTPMPTGRIYPTAVVAKSLAALSDVPVCGGIGTPSLKQDLSQTFMLQETQRAFSVERLQIEGPLLTGEVTVLDTPQGRVLQTQLGEHPDIEFRPFGIAHVTPGADNTVLVNQYQLLGAVALVPAEKEANGMLVAEPETAANTHATVAVDRAALTLLLLYAAKNGEDFLTTLRTAAGDDTARRQTYVTQLNAICAAVNEEMTKLFSLFPPPKPWHADIPTRADQERERQARTINMLEQLFADKT